LGPVGHRRDTTEGDAAILPVAALEGEGRGDRYDREVVHLPVLELGPAEFRAGRRVRDLDMRYELVFLEDGLAEDILARPDEVAVERHVAIPADTGDLRFGVEREERGGGVGRVDDVAELTADDRVVTVVARHGVAEVATLLVRAEVL